MTPSPTPTPTPLPLQAPDWEGEEEITLHTLCLRVEQSYPGITGMPPEPVAEAAQRVLAGIGLLAVAEGTPCDATLTVTLTSEALGAEYSGGTKYCYSGARVDGQMTLVLPEHAPLTLPIEGQQQTPFVISFCPEQREDAPFAKVWSQVLLRGLAQLWGPSVFVQALNDESVRVREAAAGALAEFGPQAAYAVPALIEALSGEDRDLRSAVSDALGAIGEEAVPALIESLADEDEGVRWAAVSALREIGPQAADAVPVLIQALQDEDYEVRQAAGSALGRMGPEAIPALIRALGDEDANVRQGVSQALGLIGPEAKESVPHLVQALEEDEDWLVRSNSARALGWIEPEPGDVVPALIQALGDESEYVRAAAADALGEFGSQAREAIPLLIGALGDQHGGTRSSAARALRDITGQDLGEDPDRWRQWWEGQQ
jgi:HEAT repeat protein